MRAGDPEVAYRATRRIEVSTKIPSCGAGLLRCSRSSASARWCPSSSGDGRLEISRRRSPFTARTSNGYSVPPVRPVTWWPVVVGPLPVMSAHIRGRGDGRARLVAHLELRDGAAVGPRRGPPEVHLGAVASDRGCREAPGRVGGSGLEEVELTGWSVNESTSLFAASCNGFDDGLVYETVTVSPGFTAGGNGYGGRTESDICSLSPPGCCLRPQL